MKDKGSDPRVQRTRRLLQQSLGKLLESKKFEDISVQDIADEATVNRATFYDHYDDRFSLLECMIASRFHELLAEREVQFDGTCGAKLHAMVLALCDYLASLPGVAEGRRTEPHIESAIIAVLREILLEGLKRHAAEKCVAPEIVAAAASWAMYGAAREWAQTPGRCPAGEIAGTVAGLVAPILGVGEAAAR